MAGVDPSSARVSSPSNISQRRRSVSEIPRPVSGNKPVDDAVNTAVGQAQTENHNHIPPELIAQITQNVIRQLQVGGGLDATTPVPPPPPTAIHHTVPHSPSTTGSGTSPSMPDRVYTPPSPEKHTDRPYTSPSPRSDAHSAGLKSPTKEAGSSFAPPPRAASPYSQSSETSETSHTRPKGPVRLSSAKEETTLERIWGPLFDEQCNPTARLGQLLRGVAIHIIEDFHPLHSLVITPDKMAKYYADTKLSHEAYPWSTVFDDEQTSISRMYRDLGCQHHLVQEKLNQRPDIPGLTPKGFEHWATLLIRAHPDAEFERLQKTILEMPINNPDEKKERFPKEISRRLFPNHEDLSIRYQMEDSISEHAAIEIPRQTSHESLHSPQESPTRQTNGNPAPDNISGTSNHRPSVSFADQLTPPAASSTFMSSSNIERERKPYSNVPTESVIDDINPPAPEPSPKLKPQPIERERKPYVAQPGGGKQHEEDPYRPPTFLSNASTGVESSRPRTESIINATTAKPSRSDSTARSRPISIAQPRPSEMPRPEVHHHRASSNAGSNASGARRTRRRSPSFSRGSSNDPRRSEPTIPSYQPTHDSYSSSTSRGGDGVFDESDTRRYFDRQARDRAERTKRDEDVKNFGESPRRGYEPPPASSGRRDQDYLPLQDDYYHHRPSNAGKGYDYQQPYGGPVYR